VAVHRWCGLTLATDIPMPELVEAAPAESDRSVAWRLTVEDGEAPRQSGRRWFHHWRFPDGRRWLSLARHGSGYFLRFAGLADFDIIARERHIRGYRATSTPWHTFNHLLLDQVLPLVAGGGDSLVLHASVVSVNGRAVAFLGEAGQGKSTLAAALTRHGCRLLSDDCCVLRRSATGFDALPSYPGVRLFQESIARLFDGVDTASEPVAHYSWKRRVTRADAFEPFCGEPVPLRQLYAIAPDAALKRANAVQIVGRSARESLLDIVGATFYLDVQNEGRMREGFELAAEAANSRKVRLLTFPWDLSKVNLVAEGVLDDLTRSPGN
jgi:hypothetical protein